MIHRVLACLVAGLLTVAPVAASSPGSRPGPEVRSGDGETGTRICLELMDLDAPDADSEKEMELPPMKGEPDKPPAPAQPMPDRGAAAPAGSPGTLENRAAAPLPSLKTSPVVEGSVPAPAPGSSPTSLRQPPPVAAEKQMPVMKEPVPAPGLSPMILPQPSPVTAAQKVPALERVEPPVPAGQAELGELKLKPVAAPPPSQNILKLPPTGGSVGSGTAPEIPLLTGERPQELPSGKPPPAIKTTVQRTENLGAQQEGPQPGARAPASDDLDRKLIEVYERYYEKP